MATKVPSSKPPGRAGAKASDEPRAPVAVYLVRHAHAVPREGWSGRDEDRPLTDRGEKEARALAARYETTASGTRPRRAVTRRREPRPTLLLSSGASRCLATLAPLANACGLPVGTAEFLLEGSDPRGVLEKAKELAGSGGVPVLCTHGDVIWGVVELLEKSGAYLPGPVDVKKGSIWVLEIESGAIGSARYMPPAKV
ncbi:MAG: SixA phosphatase family protein [Acidimicrobiales bacterium]|jgi:8-oxo-dGTP diphosphatase